MKRQKKNEQPKSQDLSPSEKHIQPPDSSSTPEQIRWRAYQIYLTRGGGDGRELDDWLEAERELKTGKNPFTAT